jgi:hypothetical protein
MGKDVQGERGKDEGEQMGAREGERRVRRVRE